MKPFAFDISDMRRRKEAYYRFARQSMRRVFNDDGSFRVAGEFETRVPFWLYPALVISSDPHERAFANRIYAAASCWDEFNVFTTSSIAANLVRERSRMREDLVRRSEEHLSQFVIRDDGRSPSSGINDYVFHGYNDNMPAMSCRAMILAGDVLGRKDFTDRGLFHLEGLYFHFDRRGLLSEYTSGTYTAITLTALMDIAECSTNDAAREMALACCNRILLDIFGHWHQHVGGLGGAESRAYTADCAESLSCMNALMWYLSGNEMCIDPIDALGNIENFEGHVHMARWFPFNLAQFAEFLSPSYEIIPQKIREWCDAPRRYPFEMFATTDAGQSGALGGAKEIYTRAFHQPLYGVGTASATWFDQSGHQLPLHAVLSRSSHPQTWRDRVAIFQKTIAGELDQGDLAEMGGSRTEAWHVADVGDYHALQKRGSALVVGAIGSAHVGKEISRLKFSVMFATLARAPDEIVDEGQWHFVRFGDVYVGIRMSAMVEGAPIALRRHTKNNYLRVEAPLIEDRTVKITNEFRDACDFGYVFEIAAKDECGSFAAFRAECLQCTWEFYHCFMRETRYCGRHGELHLIDSAAASSVRFMAIDGALEPREKLSATGLDPSLAQLFSGGRRIPQRRLMYRSDYAGTPYYPLREHVLERDVPPER